MKSTLRDIAERAKVSPATVSNALNGRGGVSKSVQESILAIAQEMGYQQTHKPNRSGQHVRLIVYKSHGMVVTDTPFFSELIESIQLECHRFGLELLISHVNARTDSDFTAQIRSFCSEECNGLILLGTEMDAQELSRFCDCRSPMIVLDNTFRTEDVHSVTMNNIQAGRLAAHELYRAGHRQIGHITSSIGFNNVYERMQGLRDGLAEHGLTLSDDQIWPVLPTMNGAYEDMKRLLREGRALPEAFFAANDLMAIGCMRAMTEAGYRIPEDVSIIGMDDTAICQACTPQLTTIHVYRHELGILATRTLLALHEEIIGGSIKTEIGVSLVSRASVMTKTPNS